MADFEIDDTVDITDVVCPTTVSVVSSCLWIGTTVLGSRAFSIRWLVSADDVRKSKF